MSARIRWGILGAGWIAAHFAHDLRYSKTGCVSRIASRDHGEAMALARACGAQVSDSLAALCHAPDVDAIYIATPAFLHHRHVLMALAAGKPVLCEKPFALTAAEAREIADAAQASGCFCMEGMWTRFLPLFTELRRRVRDGELGRLSQMGVELGFPYEENASTSSLTDPKLGGGALFDLGIYGASMAYDLLGAPGEIWADALYSDTGSVRDVSITMQHDRGESPVLCSIRASHSALLRNTLDVSGASGRITVEAPFIQASRARHVHFEPKGRAAERPSALKDALRGSPAWPVARAIARRVTGRDGALFSRPFTGYGLRFEADEVARCLAGGLRESPVMPISESVAVLETMDRISEIISWRAPVPSPSLRLGAAVPRKVAGLSVG